MRGDESLNQFSRQRAPVPLTSLIGRDEARGKVVSLLVRSRTRLVTLTGPGGVGKTHLARHVATEVQDDDAFTDGALLVSLAAITDPALIEATIAGALGLGDGEGQTGDRLRGLLGPRRLLLVLDNFERLLAGASVVTELLADCPGVKALVTSRAVLRATGEHVVPVAPLPFPDLERPWSANDVWGSPAVRLFVERARAAGARIETTMATAEAIARICRWVDGLPLAIELAAARAAILPPALILERLEQRLPVLEEGPRDSPARLRTIHDAIAWSYDLLAPEEQALFRRLAVCGGGFSLETAAALARGWSREIGYPYVGGVPLVGKPDWYGFGFGRENVPAIDDAWSPPPLLPLAIDVVAGLAALNAQSLIRPVAAPAGGARYDMLETIREYGVDRLDVAGETEAVQHAHAAHFVAAGERAGEMMWSPDGHIWAARIEQDLGNIRAALGWLAERGEPGNHLCLRLAEIFWPFWQGGGRVAEGRAWLEAALARPGGAPVVRAQALNIAGFLAWIQGEDERAMAFLTESLPICREHGYADGIGRSLFFQALVTWRRGEYERMVALAQEAYGNFSAWDDGFGMGVCQITLAIVARGQGDYEQALTLLEAAHAVCERDRWVWGMATARYYTGEVVRERAEATEAGRRAGGQAGEAKRDEAQAVRFLQEAVRLYHEQRDPWGTGASIGALAVVLTGRGALDRAARLFGAAFAMCQKVGAFIPPTELARYRATAAAVRDELGGAAYDAALFAGAMLAPEEAVAEALAIAAERDGNGSLIRPAEIVETLKNAAARHRLTPVQYDVLQLTVEGMTAKEIARLRGWTRSNVYAHLMHVRRKLGVESNAELITRAHRDQLL